MQYKYFFLRRILLTIPVFLGVTFLTWFLSSYAGDPLAAYVGPGVASWMTPQQLNALEAKLGLDQPWYIRYLKSLVRLLQGDLGHSPVFRIPVSDLLLKRIPVTLELMVFSIILALVIGIPLGVKSASRQNQSTDNLIRSVSIISYSFPVFITGLILKLFVQYSFLLVADLTHDTSVLSYVPYNGQYNRFFVYPQSILFGLSPPTGFLLIDSLLSFNFLLFIDAFIRILLPVSVITLSQIALIIKIIRSEMLKTLKEDFVLMAKSKGLSEGTVLYTHALQNSLQPLVTVVGLLFGNLLLGTMFAEIVFNFPGLGTMILTAVDRLDLVVINGFCVVSATFFIILNLIVDLTYGFFDPRIRGRVH